MGLPTQLLCQCSVLFLQYFVYLPKLSLLVMFGLVLLLLRLEMHLQISGLLTCLLGVTLQLAHQSPVVIVFLLKFFKARLRLLFLFL